MLTRWTRAKRYETRGFGPISRLSSSVTPVVALHNLDSADLFRRYFSPRVTIVYFQKFDFLTKLGFEVQKRVGAAEPGSFSKAFFWRCVGRARARARKFDARRARGRDHFLSGLASVPKMASPLRCRGFSRLFRLFLATLFRKLQVVLFTPPPPLFRCFFSFVCILLGIRGNAALHVCFWVVGLQPSYFVWFFGSFYKSTVFPLKKGYFGSFLGVSLSFSLASFISLCHFLSLSLSLSLSLYLFFFLVFFPSLLSCLYYYLPWFLGCYLLSCFFAFASWKNNIKILHVQVWFS